MFTKRKPHAGCRKGRKMPFFSLVTLTSDLDPQTRPSEEPNTSSMRIWRKSVQQFPEIFHTQTKKHRLMAPKTEQFAIHCRSLRAVTTIANMCQ